jgi:hypothetical protein
MTLDEIEAACAQSQTLDFSLHSLEAPKLFLRQEFYPLGFPIEVRTNSAAVLSQAGDLWSRYEKQFPTQPILVDVHVVDGDSGPCPPAPTVRTMHPVMASIADANNYSVIHLDQNRTQIVVSRIAEQQGAYLKHFFLGHSPMCHIAFRYATPVHGACVARNGRGVLLCGDSGAGKSSLSFACARAGWTYITDDASYLVNESQTRLVTGNCHQVRFRPSASELFPEVDGLGVTPRVIGKPSIELPTSPMRGIACAQTAQVDFLVFLNRRAGAARELVPYRTDVARYYIQQLLWGSPESLAVQHAAVERLLTADIFELRYRHLDWAVERLDKLSREGR